MPQAGADRDLCCGGRGRVARRRFPADATIQLVLHDMVVGLVVPERREVHIHHEHVTHTRNHAVFGALAQHSRPVEGGMPSRVRPHPRGRTCGTVDSFLAEVGTVVSSFPGFTEMKRSLREMPQLRALNVGDGAVGVQEDWHGGSRRQKK